MNEVFDDHEYRHRTEEADPHRRRGGPEGSSGHRGPGAKEPLHDRGGGRHHRSSRDEMQDGCIKWRDVDPEQEDLARLMRRCGHFLYHRNGERRSQSRILYILSDRGEMTQKELMEIMHVQPGSMSEILSKLESRGCLVRGRDEEDRRRVILRITEEGRRTAQEWRDDSEAELFAALTQEEKATLRVLLIKIIHSWEHTAPPQE